METTETKQKKSTGRPRVLVVVRGGCVVWCKASEKMDLEVMDLDNLETTNTREAIEAGIARASEGLVSIN